jgi:hypothetical protein
VWLTKVSSSDIRPKVNRASTEVPQPRKIACVVQPELHQGTETFFLPFPLYSFNQPLGLASLHQRFFFFWNGGFRKEYASLFTRNNLDPRYNLTHSSIITNEHYSFGIYTDPFEAFSQKRAAKDITLGRITAIKLNVKKQLAQRKIATNGYTVRSKACSII